MQLKYKSLEVTMPDMSVWAVPVEIIATSRAKFYVDEFDDDVEKSLQEDTIPLFNDSPYEIEDWAGNQMNWQDVEAYAVKVDKGDSVDFQEGWVNGVKSLVEA